MQHYDYIILGGGISGLTFGRLLQQHTNKTFLILEKEAEVGGLCRTKNVDGNWFDIGGGHFLCTKQQRVYDFVFSHVPKESFNSFERKTNIAIHDTHVDYPLEDNLWQLSKELQLEYVYSALRSLELSEWSSSFENYIIKNVGKKIYDTYLRPYNEKLWGIPMSELDSDWAYKIPATGLRSILRSVIYKEANKGLIPSHQTFYYPKEGGFGVIPTAIYEKVKDNVLLNTSVNFLNYNPYNSVWTVNNEFTATAVITTIPWTALPVAGAWAHPAQQSLKHNSLTVSLHKAEYEHDWHWTFIPDENISEHRHFYVNNYATSNKDKCIAKETNSDVFLNTHGNMALSECIAYYENEYAYPIPTTGYRDRITSILKYYSEKNMYGLGRWGQWEYYNSDVCMEQAMQLIGKLENVKL